MNKVTASSLMVLTASLALAGCASDANSDDAPVDDVEAFCGLIQEGYDLDASLDDTTEALTVAMGAATTPDDPATIAAIHEWGQVMTDAAPQISEIYREALALTNDPELVEGLQASIDLNDAMTAEFAGDMLEVVTFDDFLAASEDFTETTLALVTPEVVAAVTYLNDFSIAECGFPLSNN